MRNINKISILILILVFLLSGCIDNSANTSISFSEAIDSNSIDTCYEVGDRFGRLNCISFYAMLDVNGEPCAALEKEDYFEPFFCEQSLMEWHNRKNNCGKDNPECSTYEKLASIPSGFEDTVIYKQGAVLVLPEKMGVDLEDKVDLLKVFFTRFYNLQEGSTLTEIKQGEVICDNSGTKAKLAGKTVIAVGTMYNNGAFGCLSWFEGKEKVQVKRNVWGDGPQGKSYAVLVEQNDLEGKTEEGMAEFMYRLLQPSQWKE